MPDHKKATTKPQIIIRKPESIYQIDGEIDNGTFHGRWHSSFGDNYDPKHMHFGTLRVFNDDTLSPGAVWPLPPSRGEGTLTPGQFLESILQASDTSPGKTIPPHGWETLALPLPSENPKPAILPPAGVPEDFFRCVP
jgi:hypothetical protein